MQSIPYSGTEIILKQSELEQLQQRIRNDIFMTSTNSINFTADLHDTSNPFPRLKGLLLHAAATFEIRAVEYDRFWSDFNMCTLVFRQQTHH